MIALAEPDAPLRPPTLAGSLAVGVPHAYSILFFSGSAKLGWFFLAISMLSPDLGLSGLLGVCAAGTLAWWLGYDRAHIRNGFLLFNPLLVCLTLAYLHRCYHFPQGIYLLLWCVSVVMSLLLSIGMQHWVGVHFGTSAHSLPAVFASYVLYFIGYSLYGAPISPYAVAERWMELPWLPPFWQAMFQAFGAMLFQPHTLAGLLVFAGLAISSPLSTLVASAALAVGMGTMAQLGFPLGPEGVTWCGFNFLLCGIALGAGYFITSGASLLLACAGAAFCALLSVALATALRYFSLPASALPYNLVVLAFVYPLRLRWFPGALHSAPAPGAMPESAARLALIEARRFPHLQTPALLLPCDAPRVITQAFAGPLTHRGHWQFALDFEAEQNGDKHTGSGTELSDYFLFGTPALAPCSGVVVSVAHEVPDNAPGQNNPDSNWGNYVLLYADAGYYVLLAHLEQHSVTVTNGERVLPGAVLGKCGNSGRSPVPHLHLHVQDSAFLGAPTRLFCLKHYIEMAPGAERAVYHTSGFPAAEARVRPTQPSAALGAVLYGWLPGEYRYRLTGEEGRTWEETLLLDFDDRGRYRLRSRRHGARLSAFLHEGVFYTTDYEGSDRSLLAFLGAGLARVPCIADAEVEWHDHISTVPFYVSAERWLRTLAEPFVGPFLLRFTYSVTAEKEGFAVRAISEFGEESPTQPPARAPREITCHLVGRRGVVKLEVRLRNDRVLQAELVDYRPAE